MKSQLALLLLALTLSACRAPSAALNVAPALSAATRVPLHGPNLALVNGTLFDGTGSVPLSNAIILISEGRIVAVGGRESVTIPNGYQVIDVRGGFVLPGLINSHVHGGYTETNLRAWAAAGVTTVRDLGARPPAGALFASRDRLNDDPRNARLVAAGPFITVPGGYPIVPWGMSSLTVTTVEEARATTLRLIDDGADLVKIALEGGATFGQKIAVLTSDQAAAIVRAAHERGKRVSVHITAAEDIARCLDAGVDDIAHMPSDAVSAGQAKRVAAAGIYWVPTLELWHNVQPPLGQRAIANLRRFIEAGGLVALGTDHGGYDAEFDLGLPLREMEWMLEAGMTPAQVIQAATRNAAVVCGFGGELGTIQPGKIADILVVQGDPFTDIHALSRVRWVLHNGVVIREPE